MNDKKRLENEVDQTLNSLEGMSRAVPGPYLFTRVKASLEREERSAWNSAVSFMSRPSVAFATIVLTLFVNAFLFFELNPESSQTSGEGEQQFANEFHLADNSIDETTNEPE